MTEQDRTPGKFGPYRVLERIGEGGMGVVYLAADSEQRQVAVKVLRPAVAGDPNARRRLAREVETMRRVRSPFVAEVVDADVTCDPPYIVTRYVRGRTLEQVIAEHGPLPGPQLAAVSRGLAAALTAVHASGVVHRDLKPGNVMLADGEPVVIDFGIAHAPDSTRITQTGMFMGTPGYLAPEVIEGKESSQASDVHSWGATVAFAATGRPPFGSGSFETIFYRIVHSQPDLEGCPPPLLPLVTAALARDPARRPAAAELTERAAALVPAELVPGAATVTAPGALLQPAGLAGPAVKVPPTIGDWGGRAGPGGSAGPAGAPDAAAPGAAAPGAAVPAGAAAGGAVTDAAVQGPAAAGGADPGSAAAGGAAAGAGAAPVAGALPGAGLPGTGSPGAGLPETARPAIPPAWPHVTQPLAIGNPAGPSIGDLLPPVQYGPPAPGAAGARPPGNGRPAGAGGYPAAVGTAGGRSSRRRMRMLFVLASVAVGAGASVVLPIAGTLPALAVLVSLRAADLTQIRAARRRAARGARASDAAVTALAYPVMLAWSVISSLLLAPVALVAAGVAAGITIVAVPVDPFPRAVAYAAGALVACYGLGPGSAGARRQLGRLFDAVGGSPGAAVVTLIGAAALAIAAMVTAFSQPAFYWPLHHLGMPGGNLHAFRVLVNHARVTFVRLAGRVVG
ncbi:MAG TPA: serine/threonine-protein kinase [Streptosporangiaceae bacterium]|nr:serine/threonine-protein kinase [Streptosporangiaceae bacterium]